MSFGGHVATMLSSIKNNRKRRHKTVFEGNGGLENRKVKNKFVSPKNASPEELKALRSRIKATQRIRILRGILLLLFIFAAAIFFILWALKTSV